MDGPPPRAAGLRLRPGLWLLGMEQPVASPVGLLGVLAGAGINLPLVCWRPGGAGLFAALEAARSAEAEALLRKNGGVVRLSRGPAAALICFPLDRGGLMTPIALAALAEAGVAPWALATSLSALVMLVPEQLADSGLRALAHALDLPAGACPAREGLAVTQVAPGSPAPEDRETVAVYAERPVRCYGLAAQPGYFLARGAAPRPAAGGPGRPAGFCFALAGADGLRFTCCLRPGSAGGGTPASLIHLQGPHFGDRWGIAHAACSGLEQAGVRPLAAAGAAHSLFLAVPPDSAEEALAGLGRFFCGPEA